MYFEYNLYIIIYICVCDSVCVCFSPVFVIKNQDYSFYTQSFPITTLKTSSTRLAIHRQQPRGHSCGTEQLTPNPRSGWFYDVLRISKSEQTAFLGSQTAKNYAACMDMSFLCCECSTR